MNDALGSDRAGTLLRLCASTGRYRIRWDASTIVVFPVERPSVDDEEARGGLARRFLDWYGPATVHDFARWAGVTREDAAATWAAVEPGDLPEVVAGPAGGVRLLPMGDPWLQLHADPPRTTPPPDVPSRLRNALAGRILLDGEPVGAWARARGDVTLDPWEPLDDGDRQRIEDEAATFTGPLGLPVRIGWVA